MKTPDKPRSFIFSKEDALKFKKLIQHKLTMKPSSIYPGLNQTSMLYQGEGGSVVKRGIILPDFTKGYG